MSVFIYFLGGDDRLNVFGKIIKLLCMNAPREMLVLRKNYKSGLYTGRRFLTNVLYQKSLIVLVKFFYRSLRVLHISLDQRCLCNTWPSI